MGFLRIFKKIICSVIIVILAFIEKILTLIAAIANIVGGLLFLVGAVLVIFEIKDHGLQITTLWPPLLIAFMGFLIPFIGLSLPFALSVLRIKLTEFVLEKKES